jgi:hypothetical protein
MTKMAFRLNGAPVDGNCTVNPLFGISLVDDFRITCSHWTDPEDVGIRKYSIKSKANEKFDTFSIIYFRNKTLAHQWPPCIYIPLALRFHSPFLGSDLNLISQDKHTSSKFLIPAKDTFTNVETSVLSVTQFDMAMPAKMQLKPGSYEITVSVEDKWGAVTQYTLPDMVSVDEMPASSLSDMLDSTALDALDSQGDVNTLLMTLQAQSAVINSVQRQPVVQEGEGEGDTEQTVLADSLGIEGGS